MKWFIVVLFFQLPSEPASSDRDLYIFTDPTYESKTICEATVTDPQIYPSLVAKLINEYPVPRKIEKVFCLEEDTLRQVLTGLSAEQVKY